MLLGSKEMAKIDFSRDDVLTRYGHILDRVFSANFINQYTLLSLKLLGNDFLASYERLRAVQENENGSTFHSTHELVTLYIRLLEFLDAEKVYKFLTNEERSFKEFINDEMYNDYLENVGREKQDSWIDDLSRSFNG